MCLFIWRQLMNNSNTENAKYLLDLIDQRIDSKLRAQTPIMFLATVISSSGGITTIHLPTDPEDINITALNPAEVPIEDGDQIYAFAINGNYSNVIVGYKKSIDIDDIYVDFTNGTDAYGSDINGNKYGSIESPLKTLLYALRRIPKNLNNRNIYVTILDSPIDGGENLIYTDGFYGGNLTIQGLNTKYSNVKNLFFSNCSASITLQYLKPVNVVLMAFRFTNCTNIWAYNLDLTYPSSIGLSVENSNVYISYSTISNHSVAFSAVRCSRVCSKNNDGVDNSTVFSAQEASYIGVLETEPSGTTRAYSDASSTVKP
jgi:hypothetical protein